MRHQDIAHLTVSKELNLNGEIYKLWDVLGMSKKEHKEIVKDIISYNPGEEILIIPCDNLTVIDSHRVAVYLKQN